MNDERETLNAARDGGMAKYSDGGALLFI